MPLFSNTTILRIIDATAIVLNQSFQLARARLASATSPVLRMMVDRDHAQSELSLLRREVEILRAQRESLAPHRRPDYAPEQRLAILQLMRLRDWSIPVVAKHFVLHPNSVRSWIKAVDGRGNDRLLTPAVVWNRIDDVVRWAVHELRRLCPEPEFGTARSHGTWCEPASPSPAQRCRKCCVNPNRVSRDGDRQQSRLGRNRITC